MSVIAFAPQLFVIVSNGTAYHLKSVIDSKRFPYRKYIVKSNHENTSTTNPIFSYIFLNWEGAIIRLKFHNIEVFKVIWYKNVWKYTLIDHNTENYFDLELKDKSEFPEFNFFSSFLFPQIEIMLTYKDPSLYIYQNNIEDVNSRIDKLTKRIEELEKLLPAEK